MNDLDGGDARSAERTSLCAIPCQPLFSREFYVLECAERSKNTGNTPSTP